VAWNISLTVGRHPAASAAAAAILSISKSSSKVPVSPVLSITGLSEPKPMRYRASHVNSSLRRRCFGLPGAGSVPAFDLWNFGPFFATTRA
jgi:hypothetical protein